MSKSRTIASNLGTTSGAGGGGVTAYDSAGLLPLSGNTAGDFGWATNTKAMYTWDGSEWDRVYSGSNSFPVFSTEPNATYQLSSSGDSSTVTVLASDPEGFPIIYSADTNPADQAQATIVNHEDGTFSLQPSTNSADAGEFTLRVKASDGLNVASKTATVTLAFAVTAIELLLVGGGGGGGMGVAGGGGAGGYRYFASQAISTSVTYNIAVGAGGAGATGTGSPGASGGVTSFSSIEAAGGGGGGSRTSATGASGASGGGSAFTTGTGGTGNTPSTTPAQGNNGGGAYSDTGGGGGGAGAVGGDADTNFGGNGGIGAIASIIDASSAATYSVGEVSGSDVYFAGGGGGGVNATKTAGGTGATGGGGDGGDGIAGTNATDYTGGGGGGGGYDGAHKVGGDGGDGVAIIRYPEGLVAATSTTGSPDIFTAGGYKYYIFKQNGSITW
jgi:hypothetical protein